MIDDFDKLSVTELRLRGMPSDQILAEQKRRGMSPGTTLPTVIWAWREPDPLTTNEESA